MALKLIEFKGLISSCWRWSKSASFRGLGRSSTGAGMT